MNREQLRQDAHKLALNHDPFMKQKSSKQLAQTITADMTSLRDFVRELNTKRLSCTQPAEEWLLDNAEFIESEVLGIRRELKSDLLKVLPHISATGQLRMYDICHTYLQQVDGRLQEDEFATFVQAYQEVSILNIAEIWTIPLMLRIAIIRQLANMMEKIQERRAICIMVDEMLANITMDDLTPERLRIALDEAGVELPMSGALIAHLVQHLRERADDMGNVGEWLMCKLENGPDSLDAILSLEYQQQATFHVSTGNLIDSLRKLSRREWHEMFEQLSHVEQTLREEALGDYGRLDAGSKDTLRQCVAKLARRMAVPENLVATQVVQLANQAYEQEGSDETGEQLPSRACHVAYYLLDSDGLVALQKALQMCGDMRRLPELALLKRAKGTYFNMLGLLTVVLIVGAAIWVGWSARYDSLLSGLVALCLLVVPASEWGVTLLHWSIERTRPSLRLLRYDYSEGIPEEAATIVVIPVIWSSVAEVQAMIERLELHYLANRDEQLRFAILGDYQDANVEVLPEDREVISIAKAEIARLNNQYPDNSFYIFQRKRKWNEKEQLWMGWERKRGKLVEFVELLKGHTDTSFENVIEDERLNDIKYIITLDADTELTLESARRMVSTLHLNYNRPRLNATGTRVVEGYGVLQPRIGMTHEASQRSRLARLWAAEPGTDPYSFAVFDPYQDGLGEGIFTGKGIFAVDVFYKVLCERIPDNKVLSHDLLEGGFMRAGLLSDIELIDEHPATFSAHQKRLHRWVRGDWQLLLWLRNKVRDRRGELKPADLSVLTRWQLIDNMRRSLLLPSLMLILLLSIWLWPGSALRWFTLVLATLFLPVMRQCFNLYTLRYCKRHVLISMSYTLVTLLTLPYQAVMLSHAIVVTLYRVLISKRRLLEWTSQAEVDRRSKQLDAPPIQGLYGGYALTALYLVGALMRGVGAVQLVAVILSIGWLLAPLLVRWLNEPWPEQIVQLAEEERERLTTLARDIWAFYNDYVTESDHWLPPDNVQIEHERGAAHRTSPTNIGMYLTCALAAQSFGFITVQELLTRVEQTVSTIERCDKWEGHLYNWYDTQTLQPLHPIFVSTVDSGNYVACLITVKEGIAAQLSSLTERTDIEKAEQLLARMEQLIEQTNFRALYDDTTELFSLGYHVTNQERDAVLYDLLASEARQASFVAIALGQVSVSHWHTLGRTMTRVGKQRALLSWTGTMFEYLMPWLVMRTYRDTVWDRTYRAAVDRQIEYAREREVPFGISESGYYAFDYQLNYQYQAFGVPGLGFKRGLEQDLVIAPYATILALPYASNDVLTTLNEIEQLGGRGQYGFYEAIDFTARRMPKGENHQVIRSFMAHHLGMSMLTLCNVLLPDAMIDYFHADKRVRAAQLLLQERMPKRPVLIDHQAMYRVHEPYKRTEPVQAEGRTFTNVETEVPEVSVLSNGTYTSVVTNSGSGFHRFMGLDVTRWREDPVRDPWGSYVYIHDVTSGQLWSPSYQPCRVVSEEQTVRFELDQAVFTRKDGDIETKMAVSVSPEWPAEIRRITLRNTSAETRIIEVTTYAELSLTYAIIDAAHPTFSKLFIRTDFDSEANCLVAGRRAREATDKPCWAAHTLFAHEVIGDAEFETDRPSFVGRGHGLAEPRAIRSRLSGKLGSVADPVFVMRQRVSVPAGKQVQLFAISAAGETREEVVETIKSLCHEQVVERSFQLAWNRVRIELRNLHLTSTEANEFQRLMGYMLYTPPLRKARIEHILANRQGQSSLWSFGISGDRPIAVVRIAQHTHLSFVAKLLTGHEYLRRLGLLFELVILNESDGGYYQDLQNTLQRMAEQGVDRFGQELAGIYVIPVNQLQEEDLTLLLAVARCELHAGGPSLKAQLRLSREAKPPVQSLPTAAPSLQFNEDAIHELVNDEVIEELQFYNGFGGFTADGSEYHIIIKEGKHLPAPWINVLANRHFGTIISELGTGYSWTHNSREFKLTPWSNDTVLDPPGEIGWLRDEASGAYWPLTPAVAADHPPYVVKHGLGYSSFHHRRHAIEHEMKLYVPLDDPVKLMRVSLRNLSEQQRDISITYYAEWVLGVQRQSNAPYIVTQWDERAQLMTARNHFQENFADAIAFLAMYELDTEGPIEAEKLSWTAMRQEFIGRNGQVERPDAMQYRELSRRVGVSYEPCGAIQLKLSLAPGETREVVIMLGSEMTETAVINLAEKYRQRQACEQAMQHMLDFWNHTLHQTTVSTPSAEMDVLLNGWLLYQSLCCRMWARTAFYQAGGAYGYRDQLQDSLALLHTLPDMTRQQILLHAAHQYEEGDVQHWWHVETERGIRTLFTDDLLWLPYVTARYVEQTGDHTVLEEVVHYITSEPLQEGEHERYEPTVRSEESGTVYEHCLRAIDKALSRIGEHGIPLIGVGDWNDGMNLVGAEGRGESVWLGWFLSVVIEQFSNVCMGDKDTERQASYEQQRQQIIAANNEHGWDGQWYRRAFTDSGSWLGSIHNNECRIDAIAQSWSVISGGAPEERARQAMQSFDHELVERDLSVIHLLTPPFDKSDPSPGYIQGYPPGIRENGAQYTHGVLWSVDAWSVLGDGDKAFELFDMLNPINHTRTEQGVKRYAGEPYVMSADVYTAEPHRGKAGWTWYTGSSSWMYQVGLESILGIVRRGTRLYVNPCIPKSWPGFTVNYRFGTTYYIITVSQSDDRTPLIDSGTNENIQWHEDEKGQYIELQDDGAEYKVFLQHNSHSNEPLQHAAVVVEGV